ncbi:hypothetical protein Tco_1428389 [Tanacetum coccineum]
MLRGRPPIKASKSFSLFGTMFGHKSGDNTYSTKASSVKVPVANVSYFPTNNLLRENTDLFPVFTAGVLVRLLALTMAAVCASRAAVKSAVSCQMASKVMAGVSDVDVLLGGILST